MGFGVDAIDRRMSILTSIKTTSTMMLLMMLMDTWYVGIDKEGYLCHRKALLFSVRSFVASNTTLFTAGGNCFRQ